MSVYQKLPLTIPQILCRLETQNLIFVPSELTLKLQLVSYHRMNAYISTFCLPYSDKLPTGINFDKVWNLYEFDRQLRFLVSQAIEPIEIAFRTSISENLIISYGTHWFLQPRLFSKPLFHNKLLQQMDAICLSGTDPDIKRYQNRYEQPVLPPSWIIIEKLSFGTCVNIFRYLRYLKDKKQIARLFSYHPTALESWLESLRYTRNLCAHHERLWNRWYVWSPKLDYLYPNAREIERSFYAQAIIISRLLTAIIPEMKWKEQLYSLMSNYPELPFNLMGFQVDWMSDAFWDEHSKSQHSPLI